MANNNYSVHNMSETSCINITNKENATIVITAGNAGGHVSFHQLNKAMALEFIESLVEHYNQMGGNKLNLVAETNLSCTNCNKAISQDEFTDNMGWCFDCRNEPNVEQHYKEMYDFLNS